MERSINLIVILDKTGRHSVNVAPTDCCDLRQAQAFLSGFGSGDKIVNFFSIQETEPDDPGFGMFVQLLTMDTTRGTIESIMTRTFLCGLNIPRDIAAGLV